MMTDLPKLTEFDIVHLVGSTRVGRAHAYVRDGAIIKPCRTGFTLKAHCQGTHLKPYYVKVTLGVEDLSEQAYCSCPQGYTGDCEHVAGLLLMWLQEPDEFVEAPTLKEALQPRSKEELMALIEQMVTDYPMVDTFLTLPLAGRKKMKPVDRATVQRRAIEAFSDQEHNDGYLPYESGKELNALVQMGNKYAKADEWPSALIVYEVLAREIMAHYEIVNDEDGELNGFIGQCISGLGRCLVGMEEAEARQQIYGTLLDIYRWNQSDGADEIGRQTSEVLLKQSEPEENAQIVKLVREAIDESGEQLGRALGYLLLELQRNPLYDKKTLQVFRHKFHVNFLIDRLLCLGRAEDAEAELRRSTRYNLLELAELFVTHQQAARAEQVVRERMQEKADETLLTWLRTRVEEQGNMQEGWNLTLQLFTLRESLARYQELKTVGTQLAQWDTLRAELLKRLTEAERYHILTEIHLADNEIEEALKTLPNIKKSWLRTDMPIQVAQAAEKSHPHEAIRLYLKQANHLIAERDRKRYVTASIYLTRIRDLYIDLKEQATWQQLIGKIRADNSGLKALKEELKKAGL